MGKSKAAVFTVFFGEESYLLDRELQRGKRWPDRMVTVLDGVTDTEGDVLSALEQITIDGSDTAVVLDNAQKIKMGKAFEAYVEGKDPKDTSSVLVAIYRKAVLSGVWVKAGQKGRVIEHKKYKPWEKDNIYRRLNKEAGRFSLHLTKEAFETLLKVYGDNLQGASNEVQKLSFVIGKGGDITREHVLSVCPRQMPVMPWDVSDAAANKSLKQAMTYLSLLFRSMGEGAAVPVVASLMRQTERLLIGRSLFDKGVGKEAIGSALNMRPFLVEQKLLPMIRKHSMDSLKIQMKKLCELEVQIKGAAQSKRTLVELAVHHFAA